MKCISIQQPWANLIASGQKTIETRNWFTPYRGGLAIASSKYPKIKPAGCIVAVANLVDCRPMTVDDKAAACGALYEGAYSWVFENIRAVDPPQPVSWQLGIYEISLPPGKLLKLRPPQGALR